MSQREALHTERGAWDVKRHITLPKMRDDSGERRVLGCLKELPGIREVGPRRFPSNHLAARLSSTASALRTRLGAGAHWAGHRQQG
jgi:hypothetical protein